MIGKTLTILTALFLLSCTTVIEERESIIVQSYDKPNNPKDQEILTKDSTNLPEIIEQLETMTKVNDKPYVVFSEIITLCRMPTKGETISNLHTGPHDNRRINVYVNEIGKEAMTKMKNPIYPEGSIIVKEKLPIIDTIAGAELYTIMIKREKGFSPDYGDWEFGVIDGDLKESQQGILESCVKCHKAIPEMDYVFRDDYLGKNYFHQIYDKP